MGLLVMVELRRIEMFEIREAKSFDFERLEEILVQNNMLDFPEVDGKEAMSRVCSLMGKYFLVAESENYVVGMIRGCYDGSRALIHQMVVDEEYQCKGIGKQMIGEIGLRFKEDGAKSVAVTSGSGAVGYYGGLGFEDVGVRLMVRGDV